MNQLLGEPFPGLQTPLEVFEDGGELVVVSAMCWFIHSLAGEELEPLRIRIPYV